MVPSPATITSGRFRLHATGWRGGARPPSHVAQGRVVSMTFGVVTPPGTRACGTSSSAVYPRTRWTERSRRWVNALPADDDLPAVCPLRRQQVNAAAPTGVAILSHADLVADGATAQAAIRLATRKRLVVRRVGRILSVSQSVSVTLLLAWSMSRVYIALTRSRSHTATVQTTTSGSRALRKQDLGVWRRLL